MVAVNIPKHIYQTWRTKTALPPKMQECMQHNSRLAPEYVHHLYDDADCRAFIAAHFDAEVLQAYDALIPAAFRADLWRYCVIFVNGGVYMDAKYRLTGPLDDWLHGNDGVFVLERDLPGFWREGDAYSVQTIYDIKSGDPKAPPVHYLAHTLKPHSL